MNTRDLLALGVWFRLLSGVLGAGMFVSVKSVSEAPHFDQIVFFGSFLALVPLVIFLCFRPLSWLPR